MTGVRSWVVAGACCLTMGAGNDSAPAALWGEHGHRMIGQLAAEALPAEMPEFFRRAAAQLSYLNVEPDRWRDRVEQGIDPAMDALHAPEHYINFERVPGDALHAPHRIAYIDSLRAHGVSGAGPGFITFRMLEVVQQLRVGFRLWRATTDPAERAFIEARIRNDAGILGHYAADGSNPHHTTIHHNGWVGDNPHGFTTDRTFHRRFETIFVGRNVAADDVRPLVRTSPQLFRELRPAILGFLRESHSHVETLYRLDQRESFGPDTRGAEHKRFAAERLAAGAAMLRDLWWTAWVTSGTD